MTAPSGNTENLRHYKFFDVTVALRLPPDQQEMWDLLYGRFAVATDTSTETIVIEVAPPANGLIKLTAGPIRREVPLDSVMIHLQDIVQNHVLSFVMSHCLFHGACWNLGGKGLMILAESGVGKTTLSLAHWHQGGDVLSDEIAAWDTEANSLDEFPRALAVRPESMQLCNIEKSYPLLHLDEEKYIVPLRDAEDGGKGISLAAVIILEGEVDDVDNDGYVFEMSVAASHQDWVESMKACNPELEVLPHPDGNNWWRCRSDQPMKAADLHEDFEEYDAVLTGYHRGAYRAPTYDKDPVIQQIDSSRAAEVALSHLINARALAEKSSPIRLMGQVRAMMRQAACYRCVPGRLEKTLEALKNSVQET